jgi:hypothetical protein
VSVLFAAFLGYNPIEHLVGPHVLGTLSAASRATLTGRSFFPQLISVPFRTGLHEAFLFAILACLIAAGASLMRGGQYHYAEQPPAQPGGGVPGADAGSGLPDGDGAQNGVESAENGLGSAEIGVKSVDQGAGELARTTTAEEQHAR